MRARCFLLENRKLVGVSHIKGHRRSQKLHRIIGFQKRCLIGDQRISCRVAFVEPVSGEFGDQFENIFSPIALDATLGGTLHEPGPLVVHFLFDFLAHRPAQQIGITQRITGKHLGNLHHLFLIDDYAIGIGNHWNDGLVQEFGILAPMFAGQIFGDVLHRTRPEKRDQGYQVFKIRRRCLDHKVAHAGTFKLKNSNSFATRQHLEGIFVVKRYGCQVDAHTTRLDQLNSALQHGERLQSQNIKLHQTGLLDPFHVELGYQHVRARVAIKRHQISQWPVGNHHPGGVG